MANAPKPAKPIPPPSVWEVMLPDGEIIEITACRVMINGGALGFKDTADDYFTGFANGQWATFRLKHRL
jgi:hypothetical protein